MSFAKEADEDCVGTHPVADTNSHHISSLFLAISRHVRYTKLCSNTFYSVILFLFYICSTMLLHVLIWTLEPSQSCFHWWITIDFLCGEGEKTTCISYFTLLMVVPSHSQYLTKHFHESKTIL